MGVKNGTVIWPDASLGAIDGATELTLLCQWESEIPLGGAHPANTGIFSKWGTILPAGNRVFRWRRNGRNLQFTLTNGLFVGELMWDRITTSNPISDVAPALYKLALRWRAIHDLEIFVNSTTPETLTTGPDHTGHVPNALIAGSTSDLRFGVNQGFGPETQLNGCRAECAVFTQWVDDVVIADHMAGYDLEGYDGQGGLIYSHHTDQFDMTDLWNGIVATYTTGLSCVHAPVVPKPTVEVAVTYTQCGHAFIPNPCRRGC